MSNELKNNVLHAFNVLGMKDCDLRTITIVCNPNYKFGADSEVKLQITDILTELIKDAIVKTSKHPIYQFRKNSNAHTKKTNITLFSFIKDT